MTLTVHCPSCKVALTWGPESPYRPFCSARCKQLDFCAWAHEAHVIPGDSPFADLLSEDFPSEDES